MKIVLYTNIMTPYRKYFYDLFFDECKQNGDEFIVLVMAENEKNRSWFYRDFQAPYTNLLKGKTISRGETYIHFNSQLGRKLKNISPDIVIASGSYLCPGTWKIARLKKKLNYKAYFWSESHLGEARTFGGVKILIRELLRKKFYKGFDGFLCPGKLAFSFVEKYAGCDVKKIYLPNLVDESIFTKQLVRMDPLCQELHNNGKKVIFIPARLSEVKGIGPFIELVSKIKNKDSISLVIAGEGALQKELKAKAKSLGVDAYFVGAKRQEEVAELYKCADIFALPSLSDPNPLTCVEALWSKKPLLVSSHVGNYPEVIAQRKNGYMFSYDRPQEAVRIIEELVSKDNEWIREAGKKSYNIALTLYDSRKTIKRVRNELCKIDEAK